jgi:hypothetical protein
VPVMTPQQYADKWAAKAAASGNDYKQGIMNVTVAPGQLAAANQDVMMQKWNEAISSGRWASRVAAVSLGAWQQAAVGKGAQNYANGINAGKAKAAAAAAYYLPVAAAVKDAVRNIPRDGGAGSLERVRIAMQMFQTAKQNRR